MPVMIGLNNRPTCNWFTECAICTGCQAYNPRYVRCRNCPWKPCLGERTHNKDDLRRARFYIRERIVVPPGNEAVPRLDVNPEIQRLLGGS